MNWNWVSLEVALAAHHEQIADHGGGEGVRDSGMLESAMARPQNLVAYGYPDGAELAAAYGGSPLGNLTRAADLAREDGECLDRLANDRYPELCAGAGSTVEVDAAALTAEPAALRRRVLLRALRSLSGGREVGFDHVDAALEVAAGQLGSADLPGARVELRGGKLVLVQQDAGSK